jgi:hypothetical protein
LRPRAWQPWFFAAHNKPQPAPNEFDVSQSSLAKFDLGLQSADIPRRGGGIDKFAKAELKAAEWGLDETHSILLSTHVANRFEHAFHDRNCKRAQFN